MGKGPHCMGLPKETLSTSFLFQSCKAPTLVQTYKMKQKAIRSMQYVIKTKREQEQVIPTYLWRNSCRHCKPSKQFTQLQWWSLPHYHQKKKMQMGCEKPYQEDYGLENHGGPMMPFTWAH